MILIIIRVYRGTNASGSLDYYAKITNNEFTDDIGKDGKEYFYKVTVVDKDGLESDKNIPALQGLTLPKPKAPAILEAKIIDNKTQLKWSKIDPRTKSYTIIKTTKKGWLDSQTDEIKGITDTSYQDANVYAGIKYIYQIIAVDAYGIESEPSMEVDISSDDLPPYIEQKNTDTKEDKTTQKQNTNSLPLPKGSIQASPDLDTSSL